MTRDLLSSEEVHQFGLNAVVPYIRKEGVEIEYVNNQPNDLPQIVGKRWGSKAVIFVRTAMYPGKGSISEKEFEHCLALASKAGATAFFASVGLACMHYPDRSKVQSDADMRLPIRNAGFAVAYEGLLVMTTSDKVRIIGS